MNVDLLAVMAHPDDAELLCGGTLARTADRGHRTAILDLTRGEMGSRGTPELRATEAEAAAKILGVAARANAGLPDGHLANNDEMRRVVAGFIRQFRPRVVILPYLTSRHPDHHTASSLVRDACFLSGLRNYPAEGEPFRPAKLCYALSFREDTIKPTFVVDITEQFERKLAAIACFASQFEGVTQAGEAFPTGQTFAELIASQSSHYGSLIRTRFGEPFWMAETIAVDDVMELHGHSL